MSGLSYSSLIPPNLFILVTVVGVLLARRRPMTLSVSSFFPQVTALLASYYALHELFGFGWYLCRYGDW